MVDSALKWFRYIYSQLLELGCLAIPYEAEGEPGIVVNGARLSHMPENEGELLEIVLSHCYKRGDSRGTTEESGGCC